MYDVARITGTDAFADLAAEWQRLHAAARGGIFADHGFLLSWAETFGRHRTLDVRLLRQGGDLVGAMPMFATGRDRAVAAMGEGRAGMAQWLLHPDLPDPEDALARLLRPAPFTFLRLEPAETPQADLLERAAQSAGLSVLRKRTIRAARAASDGGFDGYLKRLKSKTRQVFRRGERNLAALGIRDLRSDRDGPLALEAYIAASRASWKGLTGTGYGTTREGVAFLRLLQARLGPDRCLFAARVADGDPVSGRFVLAHDGVHYGMANDFNEAYAPLAAGRNSVMHSIREALDGGARAFDFTRSSEFIDELATETRPLERLLIHRPADPALSVFFVGQAARRLRRRATRWKKGRRGALA